MTWTVIPCRDSKGKEYLHLAGPGQWLDVVPLRAGPIETARADCPPEAPHEAGDPRSARTGSKGS